MCTCEVNCAEGILRCQRFLSPGCEGSKTLLEVLDLSRYKQFLAGRYQLMVAFSLVPKDLGLMLLIAPKPRRFPCEALF